MLDRSSPFRSIETTGSWVMPRMPFICSLAISATVAFTSSFEVSFSVRATISTIETVGVGTR